MAAWVAVFSSACTAVPTFEASPATANDEARALLAASVEAHGGDVYQRFSTVAVAYDGRWGRAVQRIQPVLTDTGFRKSSEERLLLAEDRMLQRHQGPEGVKTVHRQGDEVEVSYFATSEGDDGRPASAEERDASALVADAYEMFLLGPSFLARHASELRRLPSERIDGRVYDKILVRVEPGFGPSDEDRVVAWFDREDHRLFRVLFTLDGLESTRGAAVDVTFHDHRWQGGALWPTHFIERVRAPIRVFAHEWSVTGLDLDRGATLAQHDADEILRLIDRPAATLVEPARTSTAVAAPPR